jgi:crotonobetainyl-CoA hydratase
MEVLSEYKDNVLTITLNRPEAGNSLNAALSSGLADALSRANEDPEVRVVIVTGAGEKIFCAGMDFEGIRRR